MKCKASSFLREINGDIIEKEAAAAATAVAVAAAAATAVAVAAAAATAVAVAAEGGGMMAEEEKIYIAVSKDVKESKSALNWALQQCRGRKICLLHVHQPATMIPMMGGKFPVNRLGGEEVRAYRDLERQKMNKSLNEYLRICSQVGVQAEKLEIEMDNIERGIVELVDLHGVKILVMGAAADKHYFKKMAVLRSKKAIFVCQQAHKQCHIWFVCKGHLILTRKAEELRQGREDVTADLQMMKFFSVFSLMEIKQATQDFNPLLIIGRGGYGNVFRGTLRNTDVAIKRLHPNSLQGWAEFQKEVDVLSRVRHPNLVTLMGTCPEDSTLIYEYLPNGSLEDRLAWEKNKTPPLSWQTRTRIAVEICSALIFLHSNKPHGIVHGDLKPANVLLDANFVSKLGDFGICRLVHSDGITTGSITPFCQTTSPKGTFGYMDPEFFSTGKLTPKSDVFAFGMVLLQLLTRRPAMGLVDVVQSALKKGVISALLDASAGEWPLVQANKLALLALWCCKMNRRNRPDLVSEVWSVLGQLKVSCGDSSSSSSSS